MPALLAPTAESQSWIDGIPALPERAPVRSLVPGSFPPPHAVADRLRRAGIDPESAGAIITQILREGWSFWLSGGDHGAGPSFRGNILEPRYGAVWAWYPGSTPAEALGGALVLCWDEPPWERPSAHDDAR